MAIHMDATGILMHHSARRSILTTAQRKMLIVVIRTAEKTRMTSATSPMVSARSAIQE